jgi:uncharacterized protein with HEPN domain
MYLRAWHPSMGGLSCGMPNVLIHDYIGVDLDEVWNVACSRILELQEVLERVLAVGDS